jgi:MFS family permease
MTRAASARTGTHAVRRRAALALLCVVQFVDVLGVTIVIVALPTIGHDLGLAERDLQWVASIYALCFGGFLLLAGRAADLYGRRRLWPPGSRCSRSPRWPAAWPAHRWCWWPPAPSRAWAPRSPSRCHRVLPGRRADRRPGWPWVFWINVPVGICCLALTATAGLVLLVYGFTRAGQIGFAAVGTLGALTLAVTLLVGFWLVERRVTDPLVPPGVFRSRQLVGASLAAFTLTAVTSAAGVLGTLYLQEALGYPPTITGLALLPFSLAAIAGSLAGAWLTARIGARATLTVG